MIIFKKSIDNINEYQCGVLPKNAEKLNAPNSTDEMMKKAAPIAAVLCLIVTVSMFIKTFISYKMVIYPPAVLIGFLIGFFLLIVHEWLHAIIYPYKANVTIGKLKGKLVFVALASYPLKRWHFIVMCLIPFVLGIVPLSIFILSPSEKTILNGFMFGMAYMGMVSPFPDVYNVILILKQTKHNDTIMFYENDIYKISNYKESDNF
jgi:hypothetical protein